MTALQFLSAWLDSLVLRIAQIRKAKSSVSVENNFSKVVFAKMLPIVFRMNSEKKTHKIILIVLS